MRQGMLLAWGVLLCAGARAQAPPSVEEQMIAAYCQPGQGCEACLSGYTHDQAVDLGVVRDFHHGGILVVWPEANGEWRSQSSVDGLPALNEAFGGRGKLTLNPNCRSQAPLPGNLQPKDGQWEITSEARVMDSCPSPIVAMAGGATGSMRDTLAFPSPFRGEIPHLMPEMIQTGPNQYEGIANAGEVNARIFMVVRSEDEFLASMSLHVGREVSPDCEASVTQTFRRIPD